jgi:tetratricopeptide (TPR) repeat protein
LPLPCGIDFPLKILFCALLSHSLTAATQHDSEIELTETTYRVAPDNTAEITYHQRWRALTAQGRDSIRQVRISYVAAFHDVEIKFIKTIKKDGSTVIGDPTSAFDTAPSTDALAPSFTDQKTKTVLAPNLETGDAVEYEAVLRVRKWPKPEDFWFVHDLTTGTRVLSETVVLDLPADRKVAFYENSTVPGKTEIVNGRRIERWTTSLPDPEKTGIGESAPLFAVSSIPSWDALGAWVYSLNKSAAEPTPEIASLAAKLTANKSSEQERIAAVYTYVATKIRYVSVSFDIGRIQPHSASVVLHNAFGDCKDQTALLSALLTAAGFKAHAVLTTPGVGVRVRNVPTPDQFDHEFTAVETRSGLIFLDTSMGPVPPQVLSSGVRGRSALLVRDTASSIIDIPAQSPVPTRITTALQGKVSSTGAFEGSVRFEFQGLAELGPRRTFLDATEADKEKILRGLTGAFRNANVRQISSSDPEDLSKPFTVECELSDKEFFPASKTSIRIGSELPTSPAASYRGPKPDKPMPMEAVSVSATMDLAVDPSMTFVIGMPVHLKTAFGSFDSESSYKSGHQVLTRSFDLNGTAIVPSDWKPFVDFMQAAVNAEARGFSLERPDTRSATTGLSNVTRLLREGAAAYQSRDYEAAERAYLEATKLDPQHRTAWTELGRAYFARHEYAAAEQAYKRQIEVNPQGSAAYDNLGLVYRALNRDDDAIVWFRKAVAVGPRNALAHENLAIALAAAKQWKEAAAEAAAAAELTPDNATRWFQLGRTQIKTGQIELARKSFDKALELTHDAMTENNIAYYTADAGVDLDRAWKLVSGALGSEARLVCDPDTLSNDAKCTAQLRRVSTMLDTAGWVLYRQGKFGDAEPYLRSSNAISPRTEGELHLASLLAKLGQADESLKYFVDAQSRRDFSRFDSTEVRSELVKAVGGETQLDSRLKEIQPIPAPPGSTVRVFVLVDGRGKVLEAKPADPQIDASAIAEAKAQTLPSIGWPGHSIRSIRTLEFRQDGTKWSLVQSYAGQASEPSAVP